MGYKIMVNEDYETEGGIIERIPVEYDGILYESRIAAWRAFWDSMDYPDMVGYNVYVKEV